MAGNHGFTDGNKRTAWLLVETLIARSGRNLDVPDDEPIDDLVVGVVSGEVDFDELVSWFKGRLIKV